MTPETDGDLLRQFAESGSETAFMKNLPWIKFKFVAGLGAAALLAVGAATVAISQISAAEKLTPNQIIEKSRETYADLASYRDDGRSVSELSGMTLTTTFSIRLARPDLYRIEWSQAVAAMYTNHGVVWSAGAGEFTGGSDRHIAGKTTRDHPGSVQRK
jgi:hypothetical protein